MNPFFSLFHKIIIVGVASVGAIVSSVLPGTSHHIPSVHHQIIQPVVVQRTITINKTVHSMGKEVRVNMQMPENGGTIEGVISGDCQGTIDGTYSGQPLYSMNGKGDVTCTIGFLSLPAIVNFTGNIYPEHQTADIHYTITSGSNFSKTGDITIPYTE
jgi:hypothetical protein